MGTNYYLQKEPKVCPTCQHDSGPPPLHIGKSSGGWCFSLHVEPTWADHPKNLDDWIALFRTPGAIIKDEYDRTVSPEEMIDTITKRSWKRSRPPWYASWDEYHKFTGTAPGPNGCTRHVVDGSYCIGNGEGTWDLIVGEFS